MIFFVLRTFLRVVIIFFLSNRPGTWRSFGSSNVHYFYSTSVQLTDPSPVFIGTSWIKEGGDRKRKGMAPSIIVLMFTALSTMKRQGFARPEMSTYQGFLLASASFIYGLEALYCLFLVRVMNCWLKVLFSFSCPYLHRVAGDVERRYHLRYYKTATCVHETDTRGYCVKNGPHCAFAHGPLDLRQPVYDIRELQAIEKEETEVGQAGIENNKAVLEDPRWQGLCSTVRCSKCT